MGSHFIKGVTDNGRNMKHDEKTQYVTIVNADGFQPQTSSHGIYFQRSFIIFPTSTPHSKHTHTLIA